MAWSWFEDRTEMLDSESIANAIMDKSTITDIVAMSAKPDCVWPCEEPPFRWGCVVFIVLMNVYVLNV